MRVLVTDDDEDLRLAISYSLRGAGLAVDTASDIPDADFALAVNSYDCAVFDRVLPSGDALNYVRARRAAGSVLPVLFLTGLLVEVEHRLEGLQYGEDYLAKPFAMEELIARVFNLGRWVVPAGQPPKLTCGDVVIDPGRHEVRRAGVLLTLTRKEFDVLELLVARAGEPVSRTELVERCWDAMAEPKSNMLDVVIGQLRRKLRDPPMIQTVRGIGYRIAPA